MKIIVNSMITRVNIRSAKQVKEQEMESVEHLELMEEKENKPLQQRQRDRLRRLLRLRLLIIITNQELIQVEAMVHLFLMMKKITRRLKISELVDISREYLNYQTIVLFQVFHKTIAGKTLAILHLSIIIPLVKIIILK